MDVSGTTTFLLDDDLRYRAHDRQRISCGLGGGFAFATYRTARLVVGGIEPVSLNSRANSSAYV